ncbi:hypothetical protein [Methylotuvimicrobium sp. KM2]|jgi:hypothetical protein
MKTSYKISPLNGISTLDLKRHSDKFLKFWEIFRENSAIDAETL